jgi:hypothetical protein
VPAVIAARRATPTADGGRAGSRLIAALLIFAAALDLTRCSLVVMTLRHPGPAIGLVAAGMVAAAVSLTAAQGYNTGRRWAPVAALLVGLASAPQASASGFRTPFTIPDVATAAVGVVLAVAIIATAGRRGLPGHPAVSSCAESPPEQLAGPTRFTR